MAGHPLLERLRATASRGSPGAFIKTLARVDRARTLKGEIDGFCAELCGEALKRAHADAEGTHAIAEAALRITRNRLFEKYNRWQIGRVVLVALARHPSPSLQKQALKFVMAEEASRAEAILEEVRSAGTKPKKTLSVPSLQAKKLREALRRLKPDRVMKSMGWTSAWTRREIESYRGEDRLDAIFQLLYEDCECQFLYVAARAMGFCKSGEKAAALKVASGKVRLVQGSLKIDKALKVEGALVVLGDLAVGGSYRDLETVSALIVLGSLRAASMDVMGAVLVGGDVSVKGILRGQYNDASLSAGGVLTCRRLLCEGDYAVEARSIRERGR